MTYKNKWDKIGFWGCRSIILLGFGFLAVVMGALGFILLITPDGWFCFMGGVVNIMLTVLAITMGLNYWIEAEYVWGDENGYAYMD